MIDDDAVRSGQYVPAAHVKQEVDPAGARVPGKHRVFTSDVVSGHAYPAGHSVHALELLPVRPPVENRPAGHVVRPVIVFWLVLHT